MLAKAEVAMEARSHCLSWRLHAPLEVTRGRGNLSLPGWLEDVRSVRGLVLFDNGRRPRFRTEDRGFLDVDPIDLHSYHILGYHGPMLVGCVRLYPLAANGPACLSQQVLGEESFVGMLHELGFQHSDALEIGRWIAHPAYRAIGRLGTRLAAASAALAITLARASGGHRRIVVCAVGTGDQQDLMLARVGLTAFPMAEPVRSPDYHDNVRVMYCINAERLNRRFLGVMEEMAKAIGLVAYTRSRPSVNPAAPGKVVTVPRELVFDRPRQGREHAPLSNAGAC